MSGSLWTDPIAAIFAFYSIEAQIPAMQQSCKYFCNGVDAHPCFSPRFQLDKQALHWWSLMSQWMPGAWYLSLTGSFKVFLAYLVFDCSGTLWIETLVYNLCLKRRWGWCGDIHLSNKEVCEVIFQRWEHSPPQQFLIYSFMFLSPCSGCCGIIFWHTELFLGPASGIDSAPFFLPVSLPGMMKLQ